MAFEPKKLLEQSKELWNKFPPKKRYAILAGVGATVLLLGWLVLRTPKTDYAVLVTGVSAEDAHDVTERLSSQSVPYKLANGGSTILVPASRVDQLKLEIAGDGGLHSGVIGDEILNKSSFGTSSTIEAQNIRRAREGELTRTILSLQAVERARVHIAQPERALFKDEDQQPSASVLLKLRRGRQLTPAQVRGIVHLVASGIPGLRADRVTVVDDKGAVLSQDDEAAAIGADEQRALEKTLSQRIKDIIERRVGVGHVAVAVTAELDRSQTDTTQEFYDKNAVVIRSQARTEERVPGDPAKDTSGIAGARGNLPGAPGPTGGDPAMAALAPGAGAGAGAGQPVPLSETQAKELAPGAPFRMAETINYDPSRTLTTTKGPKFQVKRLHVAVLVDQMTGPMAEVVGPGGKKKMAPSALKAEDIADIEKIASQAAGINVERGDKIQVSSAPFFVDEALRLPPEPKPALLPGTLAILIGSGVAGIGLLAYLGLLAKRRLKYAAATRKERAVERAKQKELLARQKQEEKDAEAKRKAEEDEAERLRQEKERELLTAALPARLSDVEKALKGEEIDPLPELAPPDVREKAIEAARSDTMRAARVISSWLAEAHRPHAQAQGAP